MREVPKLTAFKTTRVGGGPFKTEDLEEAGTKLQDIGA